MNARTLRIFALLCWLPLQALAQGFAGLGTNADGYAIPESDYRLSFPQDHGPHPDFRIEWWYLTANLQDRDGTPYGIQWTLFRSALQPGEAEGWRSPQLWMAHAGLTSATRHFSAERLARGGIGQAGVTTAPFSAWIDDWHMTAPDATLNRLKLSATDAAFAYDLTLTAEGPLILHGAQGYSVKSREGQASYYYSQPRYTLSGTVTLEGQVIPVTGQAWLDREWSSQPLSSGQSGWDWFSLSLDSGAKLMGFRLRDDAGDFTSGTWITPDGQATALSPGAFQARPLEVQTVDGTEVPTRWEVRLPDHDLAVEVTPLNPDSWMDVSFAYWEGPVQVTGTHQGVGYLEMTGYR